MQTARDNPKFKVPGGSTPIPNWILDTPNLTATEKLVLCCYHRSAFGYSVETNTSAAHVASMTGYDRNKTVRNAMSHLRTLGLLIPKGERHDGFAQAYELELTPPEGWGIQLQPPAESNCNPLASLTAADGESNRTIKSKKKQKELSKKPRAGITANANVTDTRNGKRFSASVGSARPSGARIQLTVASVNDAMLSPGGYGVSDDPASVLCDLSPVLYEAGGDPISLRELDQLIELRGVKFCNLWSAWLLRKVAAEYEAGRPVKKPTGLYINAVRQGWKVSPAWPKFDNVLHTVAARTAAEAEALAEATAEADAFLDTLF